MSSLFYDVTADRLILRDKWLVARRALNKGNDLTRASARPLRDINVLRRLETTPVSKIMKRALKNASFSKPKRTAYFDKSFAQIAGVEL